VRPEGRPPPARPVSISARRRGAPPRNTETGRNRFGRFRHSLHAVQATSYGPRIIVASLSTRSARRDRRHGRRPAGRRGGLASL